VPPTSCIGDSFFPLSYTDDWSSTHTYGFWALVKSVGLMPNCFWKHFEK
jgi:hypothetical protein